MNNYQKIYRKIKDSLKYDKKNNNEKIIYIY